MPDGDLTKPNEGPLIDLPETGYDENGVPMIHSNRNVPDALQRTFGSFAAIARS